MFASCLKYGWKYWEKYNKNLSCKYSHKLLDHAKQSAADATKTALKRPIQ